jgi:NAD(P)-dependent dehydrogenase (short-subunit alcohol dehydrogenase family)
VLIEGKVAIVSGAGPGLGRAICLRLAAHGARVVIGDKSADAVEDSVRAVTDAGGVASGRATDIERRDDCDALVQQALDEFGMVDILVNDAYDGGDFLRFEDADLRTWKRTSDVNVFGTLTMTQAALAPLVDSGSGRVVMICTHGVDVIQPQFGAYTSSKAALAHLTKLLAAELGPKGVRVNAVFPGPMWGTSLEAYLQGQADAQGVPLQALIDEFVGKNALRTRVTADEVADSVVFLASDMARPITGQALYANAGESFH